MNANTFRQSEIKRQPKQDGMRPGAFEADFKIARRIP